MSEHIPNIETYTKRLNWYLQEHYPANKKITAEEWNALFLALMNQGNAQEETLEKICNDILPPHVTAINYLLDKEANHTTRIEALEQVATNHENRIDNLEDTTTEYGGRISSLENTVSNHSTRIDVLEVDALDSKARIGVLENTVDNHSSRIQILEVAEINHENRISDLENLTNEHSSKISDLDTLTQTHTTQISGLRTDADSNTSRIGTLENTMLQKAFKTETTLKYNVSNIPSAITYAKNGIKDLLIEFYNEEYIVPVAPDTTAYRKGSVIVVGIEEVNDNLVQTEIFKFKEGIVTRQITSNNGTITAISDWKPINSAYLTDLDNRVDTNTTEITNIKRDYATNATVNAKETALQNQITANRTDIDTILGDYVKKADNLNIDYLTKNELSVSDTGALIQTERLKNITKGTTNNPRQSTPIPVVDNKARLFLPQEIASLRDLVSWKNSLLGEALNYIVDFSDFPTNPNAQELQAYLNNKWAALGGTLPIIDQTTMTDESIPLSYRWYVNENAWIYSHGISDNIATNNLYNEQGTLVTPGSTGKVLGSNKKFHIMYETNGEGAVVGLDALEQDVLNNTADITDVNTDLSTYKTSNNTRVANVESRATALETKATTIEGILPTKLDKITNTLNMQGLYGRKADGTHNLLGADSNNTVGSIMLRDLNGNAHIGTPTSNTHIANKKYVDDADSVLDTAISNLTTALNTEKDTRANADSALSTRITTEETTRANADSALSTRITTAETKAQEALDQIVSGLGTKVYRDTQLLTDLDIKPYVNYNNYFNVVSINEYGKIFTSGKLMDAWDTISLIVTLFDKNATNVTADATAYLIKYRGNGTNACSLSIKRLWGSNQFDNSLYVDYVTTAVQNANSNYFELYYKSGYQGDDSKGISINAYIHRKGKIVNDYTIYNGTLTSLTEISTIGQTSLFKDIVTHNYLTNNETEIIDGYKTFTKTLTLKNTDNAYNDTPDTSTFKFISFTDKNNSAIANIYNTIGTSWNALNFQLKGKNNVVTNLEYVCSGNDTDGYTWRLDPVTDNLVDLGTSARRWKDLYLSNKAILKSIKFDIERSWEFVQGGSGVGTTLDLKSDVDGKHFRIVSPLKTNGFRFAVSETNDSNNLIGPITDNIADLGQSDKRFKDLYIAGNLSDGTNSVKVSEIVNLSSDQTITGVKNFVNAKFKVNENDYRAPLTSPAVEIADKRYLIGVSGLSTKFTNTNSNCYMQDGKLYSNGGQVAQTNQTYNRLYTTISDLGITSTTCTVIEIAQKIIDNSYVNSKVLIGVTNNSPVNIGTESYGSLEIDVPSDPLRMSIKYTAERGNQSLNKTYFGYLTRTGNTVTAVEWRKALTNNYDWIDDVLSGTVNYGEKILKNSSNDYTGVSSSEYYWGKSRKYSSGLIIQWGEVSPNVDSTDYQNGTITFPLPFSADNTYAISIIGCRASSSSYRDTTFIAYDPKSTGAKYMWYGQSYNNDRWKIRWIAIGI